MKLCIQICSGREWRSIKSIFKVPVHDISKQALGECFITEIKGQDCIFYHSGPTKTRAAAGCQHAIDKWESEIIFVLGTCGGVAKELNVFDIVMASKTVQYDCLGFMNEADNKFYTPMVTELNTNWIDSSKINKDVTFGIIGTGAFTHNKGNFR